MSGEVPNRSDLIDLTYFQLHSILSGHVEAVQPQQVTEYLDARKNQLSSISEPFGKPSDVSRAMVNDGSVALPDGIVIRVDEVDKEFVLAISNKFDIDEIQALILFRAFLYNEGLASVTNSSSTAAMVTELLDRITPFYYSERLALLRCLIPLFRACDSPESPIHDVSTRFLCEIIPDPHTFALSLVNEFSLRTKKRPPGFLREDPRAATRWAKQNCKEQLLVTELLFWSMWSFVPCTGPLVEKIFQVAYATNLGAEQANALLLLDEEASQLRQDCAATWILIMVEVLELETLGQGLFELSGDLCQKNLYTASPDSLKHIHQLVTTHTDSQYVCIYLAWAYVLACLAKKVDGVKEIPQSYSAFFESVSPNASYGRTQEPVHQAMLAACLRPEAYLFKTMKVFLEESPLFITAAAWKQGSSVTDVNAIAFRSIFKGALLLKTFILFKNELNHISGLVMALVDLVPVENISDLDSFTEIWIDLFGRSESLSVGGICAQYWSHDCQQKSRRAMLEVARSRFPIEPRRILRLVRAMTAYGFLDTDSLSVAGHSSEGSEWTLERSICGDYAFQFMDKFPYYLQLVPTSACGGSHALYEKQQERPGPASVSAGPGYTNLRPIKLPGGSVLPARSSGRLLTSDGGEFIGVLWNHEHCGWKLVLEILTDYVNRRRMISPLVPGGTFPDMTVNRRATFQILVLRLEDIGVVSGSDEDIALVTDALDVIRCMIQDNVDKAQALMLSMESGEPVVAHAMTESQPSDLVQLATMILEDAISRTDARPGLRSYTNLITSAMCVLAALLPLPGYSTRVWLFIRSTNALFTQTSASGFASALAVERTSGQYTMTLSLLHLVQQLFREAASTVLPENAHLQHVKEEVLLRAARFIHTEIWAEHLGWKYSQIGDRFEIGKRIMSFYSDILQYAPPSVEGRPFQHLSQFVLDILLFKAASSTITPLVSSLTSGVQVLKALYTSRRHADARRLIFLLESLLRIVRQILIFKQVSATPSRPSLLEQTLCVRATCGTSQDFSPLRNDPIDILTVYATGREYGPTVPFEAVLVLHNLCISLSSSQLSLPTLIGHLSNPEATSASFVRIAQHPYEEPSLRNAVWNFITLAIDKEPALASLFVAGKFQTPADFKGKQRVLDFDSNERAKTTSAVQVAREILANWKDIWDVNPQLLASVLQVLEMVWQHGLEHKAVVTALRTEPDFWDQVTGVICEEVGPAPDHETASRGLLDGVQRSNLHSVVAAHCHRIVAKSLAARILGLDITIHSQLGDRSSASIKPQSYLKMDTKFRSQEELNDLVCEVASSPYDPTIYDQLLDTLKSHFPGLVPEQLRLQAPQEQRDFGDSFTFSPSLLHTRLLAYKQRGDKRTDDAAATVMLQFLSVNLNLSLSHAQSALTEAWQALFQQTVSYLREEPSIRTIVLSIAATISYDIAREQRSGDMMATIHGERLSLLLSILESAWFSMSDKPNEIQSFMELVRNIHHVLTNDAQPPTNSFIGAVSKPFHRTLLQIIYYVARHSRNLARRPKALTAEQRLVLASMVEAALDLLIEALKLVFESSHSRADLELDLDMDLLVATFEQCTHSEINPSSTLWLAKCQETDIIKTSLRLYGHIDLSGLNDLSLLLARKRPLYGPHILLFHIALVNNSSGAAECLASDGLLAAYSNNSISTAISTGGIDIAISELPQERSPAHHTYCTMLAVVAGVIRALGKQNHYFDLEASGFVQFYGDQISRALSWTIGDPISFPLLEEMEQSVNLFQAIAECTPHSTNSTSPVHKVLRAFTNHALLLVQQINYALTHPNHLASLFEPVTAEERLQYEKDPPSAESLNRPIVAHLLHRLYRLSANILSTLITVSQADSVLLEHQEEWPINEALVIPHSKVVLGEPASMGTLLELGNATLDVLRELVNRPAGQSLTISTLTLPDAQASPLDVRQGVLTACRNLECALMYAVTQLVMWLSKPDFDTLTMDEDDAQAPEAIQRVDGSKDRRSRHSVSLAQRLRRGMTGEMATDLHTLLNRSKSVLSKCRTVLDKPSVDLTSVLSCFLQERIGTLS